MRQLAVCDCGGRMSVGMLLIWFMISPVDEFPVWIGAGMGESGSVVG